MDYGMIDITVERWLGSTQAFPQFVKFYLCNPGLGLVILVAVTGLEVDQMASLLGASAISISLVSAHNNL